MSLTKFMDKIVKEEVDEKILLIDVHNMIFRMLFVASNNDPLDMEFKNWKYLVLNNIFKSIEMFKPSKVIMVLDSKHNWRKDVYTKYKENRKVSRDNSKVDFEKFFPISNKFLEDLKNLLKNIMFLQIDYCEADDIIAILTKEIFKNKKIINIATDKDFYQLYKCKNYSQYDPIKKQIVKIIDAQKLLDMKIIIGDKGDNIPSIKRGCGPATALKILNNGIENEFINEEVKNNYIRNKQLIDFDCIPEKIINMIKKEYNEYILGEYESKNMFNFLMINKLGNMVEDIQRFNNTLKNIK